MKKERKEKDFLKTPVFKGGIKAMKEFVKAQLKYPEEALKEKIEGSVHLRYTVNQKGNVIRVKVVSGIGHGCDEEARRIVKLFKFDVSHGGKSKLEYNKTISVHFRLPKGKKAEVNAPIQQFSYSITSTPKPKKQDKIPPKPVGKYAYTLNLK